MNTGVFERTGSTIEHEPTLEELQAELVDARTAWAQLQGIREARMGDRVIHGYNDAKERYDVALASVQMAELSDMLETLENPEDKALLIAEYYLHEQQTLRQQKEQLIEEKTEGSPVLRFRRSFARFMNRGNKPTRIAKQVALGMVGGVVASTAVLTVGGVVGAAAGVTAAVTAVRGATNMARTYYSHEKQGVGQVRESAVDFALSAADATEMDNEEIARRTLERSHDIYERDVKTAQKQVRRLGAQAALSAAVGVGAGMAIGALIHGTESMFITPAYADEVVNNTTHANPGIGVDHLTNPGIAEVHAHVQVGATHNPGIDTTSHLTGTHHNPGIAGDHHINPGVSETTQFSTTNPGIDATPNYVASYTNPGIETVHYANPGIAIGGEVAVPTDVSGGFTVEYAHGDTHELIDAAKANGITITPDQAWEAHKTIIDTLQHNGHGLVNGNYIILADHGGADAYSMGNSSYQVGIAAPSDAAHWTPEAQPLVADAVDDGVINGSSGDVLLAPNVDTAAVHFTERDWSAVRTMLEHAANNDRLSAITGTSNAHSLMNDIGPRLQNVSYADGTPVVGTDATGNWMMNDSDQLLPRRALSIIHNLLTSNEAVAEKAEELLKVVQ